MKRKLFTSLAAAGLLACTITKAAAAPICTQHFCFGQTLCCEAAQQERPGTSATPDQTAVMSALEQEACRLINAQRASHGLPALNIDTSLSVSARVKSKDMKTNQYFSHTSPTYGSPFQMMKQLGISYRSAGENIAMGYRSAEAVVQAWMASATHRANILSNNYSTMGIGYADGYWTQWFIR